MTADQRLRAISATAAPAQTRLDDVGYLLLGYFVCDGDICLSDDTDEFAVLVRHGNPADAFDLDETPNTEAEVGARRDH